MISSETSYVPRGSFLDMEEGIARQYHLKPWQAGALGGEPMGLQHHRIQRRCVVAMGEVGVSKVCQGAHMKSFSLFYRRMHAVMGSLGERRCSRIGVTGG